MWLLFDSLYLFDAACATWLWTLLNTDAGADADVDVSRSRPDHGIRIVVPRSIVVPCGMTT